MKVLEMNFKGTWLSLMFNDFTSKHFFRYLVRHKRPLLFEWNQMGEVFKLTESFHRKERKDLFFDWNIFAKFVSFAEEGHA